MTDKNKIFTGKPDEEEKGLLDSVERGEWRSVANLEEETFFAKTAASNYLRKDFQQRFVTLKTKSSLQRVALSNFYSQCFA